MKENIKYFIRRIDQSVLIEAELIGAVRNSAWTDFLNQVLTDLKEFENIYLLIDENGFESEINYETAQEIIKKIKQQKPIEIIMSFSSSDPMKVHLSRLFNDMSNIANVPLTISFHLTTYEARHLIKGLCVMCYQTMIPKRIK